MEVLRLTTCNSIIEATMIKNLLENEGIECFLTNENFTTLMPGFNGVMGSGIQIMVNNTDLDKANKIINLDQASEILKCPNCQSENITYGLGSNKIKKIFIIIMSLFAFTPFSNLKSTYYCKNCKIEFRI